MAPEIGATSHALNSMAVLDAGAGQDGDTLALGEMLRRQRVANTEGPATLSCMSAVHGVLEEQPSSFVSRERLSSEHQPQPAAVRRTVVIRKVVVLLFGLFVLLACVLPSTPLPGFEGKEVVPGAYDHKMHDHMPAQRCLGLLLLVSVYWAFEPIPSHITALLIPLLIVLLRVQLVPDFADDALVPGKHCPHHEANVTGDPYDPLTAAEAAAVTSAAFFDPVILLFLGGFTMAAALDKYGVSEYLALALLMKAGSRPSRVLLTVMALCVFLSMWVSNVAASVLTSAIMLPLLRSLPTTSQWPQMVLLGIAFACNIGGMTTPIASPQNVIALKALNTVAPAYSLTFLEWVLFALPVCVVALGICWAFLRWFFKTGLPSGIQTSMINGVDTAAQAVSEGAQQRASQMTMGLQEYYVVAVVSVTVVMWCTFSALEPIFGNMGIVALIPVLALYGPGLLTPAEFNSTPWSVLILMGGGLALGNAVKSSGLLNVIATGIGHLLEGQPLFVVALTFNAFAGVLANFISSTVSAVIMLPIIAQVGLGIGHPRALVVSATIMCSGAMGLPVSSFPNANAMAAQRTPGEPFLLTSDFMKTGFPMAVFMLAIMQSLGLALVVAFGW